MGQIVKMELGSTYGRLTVVARNGYLPDGTIKYRCQCSCGNEHVVAGTVLRKGLSRSCGCLVRENRGGTPFIERWRPAFNQVIRSYKDNANKRGLIWALTDDECLQLFRSPCFYCGDIETNTSKQQRKNTSTPIFKYNGIDRCNSSLGYIASNVITCCYIDNRAKNNLSMEEYLAWLKRLTAYRGRVS